MDRKRKLDSTEAEVSREHLAHNALLTNQEIDSIIAVDDYESLQENIKNGKIIDINEPITEHTHKSMLMKACEAGSIDCAKVLLFNKADVNYIDKYSAVSYAAASGSIDLLTLIIARDELNVDLVYNTLHQHLSTSHLQLSIEIVKLLVSRLPDVNRRVHWEYILLNDAISGGYLDVIKLLLEAGANPCMTDLNGFDALEVATRSGRIDAMMLLFESSSQHFYNITIRSINKAYLCACYCGVIDIVRYLIGKGATVNMIEEGEDGCHAFDHTINDYTRKPNITLANLLIDSGFDVNTIYLKRSALYFACIHERMEHVQLLLDSGSDPNLRYPDGSSLLLDLVMDTTKMRTDYTAYITLLFDFGANANIAYEHSGDTALMIAVTRYRVTVNIDVVKLLLERGADVTQVNKEGKSVLDMLGRTRKYGDVRELCTQYIDRHKAGAKYILK